MPENAEQLMRSRYSAFVLKNINYLSDTHDPKTRNLSLLADNKRWADSVQFLKLEVIKARGLGMKATVEFKAYYLQDGSEKVHHEISGFRKISGRWFYSDGRHPCH
jgi:SEC-C motif-containing protein